jgi:hydrogenase expression/formation protein HypE
MKQAARAADVEIVTGDTKVVDRGKGDGVFINTAGVGVIRCRNPIEPASVQPGDAVLLNGDIGRHGIAVMAVREGLAFETAIESDCAPLSGLVTALIEEGIEIHCMRDLTRGGLASALVEIAEAANLHVRIEESAVPTREDVRGACEILGLDPLYVANEGRFVCFVAPGDAERALALMRSRAPQNQASLIGSVSRENPRRVTMKSAIGTTRVVDMMSGEQLPRIC